MYAKPQRVMVHTCCRQTFVTCCVTFVRSAPCSRRYLTTHPYELSILEIAKCKAVQPCIGIHHLAFVIVSNAVFVKTCVCFSGAATLASCDGAQHGCGCCVHCTSMVVCTLTALLALTFQHTACSSSPSHLLHLCQHG